MDDAAIGRVDAPSAVVSSQPDAHGGLFARDAGSDARDAADPVDIATILADLDDANDADAPPFTGTVSGRIVYSDGQGAPGIAVIVDGARLTSDTEGRFSVDAAASYALTVIDGADTLTWLSVRRRDPVARIRGPSHWAQIRGHMSRMSPDVLSEERWVEGEYRCNEGEARRLVLSSGVAADGSFHAYVEWNGADQATCQLQLIDEWAESVAFPGGHIDQFFGTADAVVDVSAMQKDVVLPDLVFEPFTLGHVTATLEVPAGRSRYETWIFLGILTIASGVSDFNAVQVPMGLATSTTVWGSASSEADFEGSSVGRTLRDQDLDRGPLTLAPLPFAVLETPAWNETLDTSGDPMLKWSMPDGLVTELLIGEDYHQRVVTPLHAASWSELRRAGISLSPGYHDLRVTGSNRVATVDDDLVLRPSTPQVQHRVSSRRTLVLAK
jgi:hypothetical protein